MAAYVGHRQNSDGTSSTTVTLGGNYASTAGNCLVAILCTQEDGGQAHTIADGGVNTWPSSPTAQSPGTIGVRVKFWVLYGCAGGNINPTITASSAHRYKHFDLLEFSGVAATDDTDSMAGAGTANGTTPALTLSTSGVNIYGTTSSNDRSWTPDTGYSEVSDIASGQSTGYRIFASSGSNTAGAQASSASNIEVAAVALSDSGGGGGRTTKNTRAFPLGMAIGMNWRSAGDCSRRIERPEGRLVWSLA